MSDFVHNLTRLRLTVLVSLVLLGVLVPASADAQNNSLGQPLTMRAAEFGEFTRLAFDVGQSARYEISYTDTQLSIAFEGRYSLDSSAVVVANLSSIGMPVSNRVAGRTVVSLLIPQGATVQDFRSGNFVVVDVFGDGRIVARERDQDIQFPGIDLPRSVTNLQADAGPLPEPPSDVVPDRRREVENETVDVNLGDLAVTDVIDFVIEGDQTASGDFVIRPDLDERPDGLSFVFNLPRDTEAAVFPRGDALWIVFAEPYGFDGSALRAAKDLIGTRVKRLALVSHPDALILRMSLRGNQHSIVEKDEFTWIVSLKDTATSPRFPLSPARRLEDNAGQQIFIPAADIGRKLTVEDPDIGDEIVILPLLREGEGLASRFNFSSAELLTTAQGLAVVPQLDGVRVERFRGGIAVAAPGVEILTEAPGDDYAQGGLRLVDFDRWRLGNEWEYRKYKSLAQYQMSVADPSEMNSARWRLARFYLGHRRGGEALGVMNLMALDDPSIEDQSDYRAARGIAHYMMGRHRDAYRDLSVPGLASEQDAELWKVLVTEKLGRYPEALEHYRRGKDILGTYEPFERAEIQLSAIRAAIEEEDTRVARAELNLLSGLELTDGQNTEAVFLTARLSDLLGDSEIALAQYEDLADSRNREVSARARYAAIMHKRANGTLNDEDAIRAFELLRYAWRGDQFEMRILLELASLYLKGNNFEKGLDTYKLASETYPQLARELRLGNRMSEIFREIFLGSYATSLSPIKGITIFWKYQELTPPGAEGDTMIRRLADRLVDLDLLAEAADLYDYQVRERLEGVPRAQIAIRQAMIYLLNREPEKAIEIMRATREPRLPADVAQNRRVVEARALSEMQRYEEAEILISQDRTLEADLLRADISWASRDYGAAITHLEKVLVAVDTTSYTIEERDRFNIMRLALAMTFVEDRRGLEGLRSRFQTGMSVGDFANSFDLLTRSEPLSGREISVIAGQIADVEQLQSYMQSYRGDFVGR